MYLWAPMKVICSRRSGPISYSLSLLSRLALLTADDFIPMPPRLIVSASPSSHSSAVLVVTLYSLRCQICSDTSCSGLKFSVLSDLFLELSNLDWSWDFLFTSVLSKGYWLYLIRFVVRLTKVPNSLRWKICRRRAYRCGIFTTMMAVLASRTYQKIHRILSGLAKT
jgi:hypothetical protein